MSSAKASPRRNSKTAGRASTISAFLSLGSGLDPLRAERGLIGGILFLFASLAPFRGLFHSGFWIADSLRGTFSLDVESLTDQFTVLAEDHAWVEPGVWQRAGRALNQRERLRLNYTVAVPGGVWSGVG